MKLFHYNKRAMMEDLFDLLFTVMIAFFALLFINVILIKNVSERDQKMLIDMNDVLQTRVKFPLERDLLESGGGSSLSLYQSTVDNHALLLPVVAEKGGTVGMKVDK